MRAQQERDNERCLAKAARSSPSSRSSALSSPRTTPPLAARLRAELHRASRPAAGTSHRRRHRRLFFFRRGAAERTRPFLVDPRFLSPGEPQPPHSAQAQDDDRAIFLHPGEPFFERLRELVCARFARDALRGGVFIDAYAAAPYLFHLAVIEVARKADSKLDALRSDEPVEYRLVAMRQEKTAQSRNARLSICCCSEAETSSAGGPRLRWHRPERLRTGLRVCVAGDRDADRRPASQRPAPNPSRA